MYRVSGLGRQFFLRQPYATYTPSTILENLDVARRRCMQMPAEISILQNLFEPQKVPSTLWAVGGGRVVEV